MITNITRNLFAILACGLLLGYSENVSAQDVSDDYKAAMTEASEVTDWDTNNNGIFDDHEFYVVNYRIWDADNDGQLTDEEWQSGMDYYVANYDMTNYGNFSDWDENQDNMVDVNEYILIMGENDVYGFNESRNKAQNTDSNTQTRQDATVMIWDQDNDKLIEKIEYGDWSFRFDQDDN